MIDIEKERVLIISNNVISNTNNNGKTILSYFDSIDCNQVRQLYFSSESPSINEYKYFRISDMDVIKGKFIPAKRGGVVTCAEIKEVLHNASNKKVVSHSDLKRLLREFLWIGSWKSNHLLEWLNEYRPTVIFFVGGDCCFAYKIAVFIKELLGAKLALYITDDYFMPRKNDTLIAKIRRVYIRYHFRKCLKQTDVFFTISDMMADSYERTFGKKSYQIVNMPESMKMEIFKEPSSTTLTYAGSLYYGRDDVLSLLSAEVKRINEKYPNMRVVLNIYTNNAISVDQKNRIFKDEAIRYGGSLNKDELKIELNKASILVFVESFQPEQIEKTKYSLSTKVPEYLSLHKPILAIGPKEIGSMQYLEGVSQCVHSEEMLGESLERLLLSSELQEQLGALAEEKFLRNNDKAIAQKIFLENLFG